MIFCMNIMITIISVILIRLRELSEIMIMDGSQKMREVITLINRWIPNLIPPQLSDHMGFWLFIGLIIWTDIHMPLLVLWIVFQALVFVLPPWLGHSLRIEKIAMSLWFWGSVFWRSDYLNREKFVTLFKHLRGIFSLKKFLEVFLAEPPVSSTLAWEQEFVENESDESLISLSIFSPPYVYNVSTKPSIWAKSQKGRDKYHRTQI